MIDTGWETGSWGGKENRDRFFFLKQGCGKQSFTHQSKKALFKLQHSVKVAGEHSWQSGWEAGWSSKQSSLCNTSLEELNRLLKQTPTEGERTTFEYPEAPICA